MLLNKQSRIKFDPAVAEHRAAFGNFLLRRSWSDTDLRFEHDPSFTNIVDQLETKIIAWYLSNDAAAQKMVKVSHA